MMDSSQRAGHASANESRRLLRKEYRKIDEEARQRSEVLSTMHTTELQDMIDRTDELHKQVNKPREQAMDAGLFCRLSEAGYKATEKLVSNQQGRTVHEFIIALRYNYGTTANPQEDCAGNPQAFGWHALHATVPKWFKAAPGVSCMLGPMDVEAKVRKVAQRQSRRPTGDVARPEELEQIQEQEKQETDRNMEEMWRTLTEVSRCPLVELVCNHRCFAQTVENMFTLSFLVRDQRAYLFHDAELGMMVQRVDARAGLTVPEQTNKRPDEQLQFVLAITMEDWEMMKKVVKPEDTKMRHRDQAAVQALNARSVKKEREKAGPSAANPRSKKARSGNE